MGCGNVAEDFPLEGAEFFDKGSF